MQPVIDPWRYATAGLELVVGLGILAAAGYGLDRWLGSSPWGLIVGAIVGIVGGLYKLVRDATRTQRSREKDSARDSGQASSK